LTLPSASSIAPLNGQPSILRPIRRERRFVKAASSGSQKSLVVHAVSRLYRLVDGCAQRIGGTEQLRRAFRLAARRVHAGESIQASREATLFPEHSVAGEAFLKERPGSPHILLRVGD
jgi:hypothetical protein